MYIALDTETTGLKKFRPDVVVTHVSYVASNGDYGVWTTSDPMPDKLKEYLEDIGDEHTFVFWNAAYDIYMLSKLGIRINRFVDAMILCRMVLPDEISYQLKRIAAKYNNHKGQEKKNLDKWLAKNKGKEYGHAPAHIIIPYALADAKQTLELFYLLQKGMEMYNLQKALKEEMRLVKPVIMLEKAGVLIDLKYVDKLHKTISKELKFYKDKMASLGYADINPNSSKQLADVLYSTGVKPTRFSHKTGKPSTDVQALLESPGELATYILKYRKAQKSATTYLKNLKDVDKDGRLRVSFNQYGARTGRFSSSGPNLQNIPRKGKGVLGNLRKCFIAPEGKTLVFIDYSQIELRLAAHFSKEKHMVEAILNGSDLHSVTTKMLFNVDETNPNWDRLRYIGKKCNFSILYGTGAQTFRNALLVETDGVINIDLYQATKYIDEYKIKHPGIMGLFSEASAEIYKYGGVKTFYDKLIPVTGPHYVGVNYKIQGTAAQILKKAILKINKYMNNLDDSMLIMTVHDELIFEFNNNELHHVPKIVKLMENNDFIVPIVCDVKQGKNWLETQKLVSPVVP